jgi:hypothetical protein
MGDTQQRTARIEEILQQTRSASKVDAHKEETVRPGGGASLCWLLARAIMIHWSSCLVGVSSFFLLHHWTLTVHA